MKLKLTTLLLIASLMGCGKKESNTIYVWNMKDIIGFWIAGIVIGVLLLIFAYAAICDWWTARKRKKKNP